MKNGYNSETGEKRFRSMEAADSAVSKIFVFINIFAVVSCAVIMLATGINVFTRALFDRPLNGAIELSTDMMVMVAYCSLPVITLFSEHISVDLMVSKFPLALQKALKIFNLVLYSVLCVYAGYSTFVKGAAEKAMGTCGSALYIPYFIFYYIIGVMLFISVLCALYNIIHIFVTGSEVNEKSVKQLAEKRKQMKSGGVNV